MNSTVMAVNVTSQTSTGSASYGADAFSNFKILQEAYQEAQINGYKQGSTFNAYMQYRDYT